MLELRKVHVGRWSWKGWPRGTIQHRIFCPFMRNRHVVDIVRDLPLQLSLSLSLSPVHNLKKELGVLGWVGLTVYTGDRVDAIPSFVRRLGCTAFYGARGWTIRTRPRSKDDNKLMQQRCSTEKRKNRCIYGVTSLLCEMSGPALCASVHRGFVTTRYSATRTNGPECTRRRRRDTNRAMRNMKRALQ